MFTPISCVLLPLKRLRLTLKQLKAEGSKGGFVKKWMFSAIKDVPILSIGELFVVSIGASESFSRNEIDPRLFILLPNVPPKHSQATTPLPLPPPPLLFSLILEQPTTS